MDYSPVSMRLFSYASKPSYPAANAHISAFLGEEGKLYQADLNWAMVTLGLVCPAMLLVGDCPGAAAGLILAWSQQHGRHDDDDHRRSQQHLAQRARQPPQKAAFVR